MNIALHSRQVVTPEGTIASAILVKDGKITSLCSLEDVPADYELHDFGSLVIAPGLVDIHIHINEPGRTEWEGFETATQAAAAGGVTTLVDMPLNSSPVTVDVPSLELKRFAAQGKCWVDVGFYGGLIPGNTAEIASLIEAGVLGIKAFLCDSGLEEFPAATEIELQAAMPILARASVPLLVHAEVTNAPAPSVEDVRSYQQYAQSRPARWEQDAVLLMLDLNRQFDCPLHIVHLAAATPLLEILQDAKQSLPGLTIETCPHYLFFSDEDVADGDTKFKCAPPIRDSSNREALQIGLMQGIIDTIGSDHSPCPVALKHLQSGDFTQAWGGIGGVQFTLPVLWTAMQKHGVAYEQLFEWLSTKPASVVGLGDAKGKIATGFDADFVVWDPSIPTTVHVDDVRHRNRLTPYESQTLLGKVHRTYLRGQVVFDDNKTSTIAHGKLLRR